MIEPAYTDGRGHVVYCGDALDVLRQLPSKSVHCCVTSPPYWGLRDYGVTGQLGLESTPQEYVAKMVERLADDEQVVRNSEGFRVATAAEDKLWMQAYFTRDELRELLPHLAAWCETGSLEARDERR